MTFKDLKEFIKQVEDGHEHLSQKEKDKLVLAVGNFGGMRGSCTDVIDMSVGFDWERGKIMIRTADPIMTVNRK